MTSFKYRYLYLLQITLEAVSPLRIGNGEKGIRTDAPVLRDVNGLPFIPGTTLAGLLSHALDEEQKIRLMGNQKEGSRLIVTEAKLLGKDGRALDGLVDKDSLTPENRSFLNHYASLPIRQHVRIDHRGTAEKAGKFDEEIVPKGSRFCFEIELAEWIPQNEDKIPTGKKDIDALLSIIRSPAFRIGSGTRSGFGETAIVRSKYRELDLDNPVDMDLYLTKSSKIGDFWKGWKEMEPEEKKEEDVADIGNWTRYELVLKPEDFLLFGSGARDSEGGADMTYVHETCIKWDDNGAGSVSVQDEAFIPVSSFKGALAHRTAFHYNRLTNVFIQRQEDRTYKIVRTDPSGKTTDDMNTVDEVTGNGNPAVRAIFGSAGKKNTDTGKLEGKSRGNILISDGSGLGGSPKVLHHVSIDRFTGGAIDGALFQEQVIFAGGNEIPLNIWVTDEAIADGNVRKAFESALDDIVSGMLPLGGGVNRGNGIFTGTVKKFNKETKVWETLS